MDSWEGGQFLEGYRILDLGTGGGLPGLVFAIQHEDKKFTLVDSIQKKCDSIERMTSELGLSNVQVICCRAEALAHDPYYREKFDTVTARALAPLPTLLELVAGFIRPGGVFIAYKGPKHQEELKASKEALSTLNLELEKIHKYDRVLLIFRKTKALSPKYPRQNGTPKKNPL